MSCRSSLLGKRSHKLFEIHKIQKTDLSIEKVSHPGAYKKVFEITDSRTDTDVSLALPILKEKRNGSWINDEHERFLIAIQRYGNSWKKIEAYVGTRTCVQIRSHCQKYYENLKIQAVGDAKKSGERKLFAVYRAFRNTTFDIEGKNKIDCEPATPSIKKFLQESNEKPSTFEPSELNDEYNVSLLDFNPIPENHEDNQRQGLFDASEEFGNMNRTFYVPNDGLNIKFDNSLEVGSPYSLTKRKNSWQDDNLDSLMPQTMFNVNYDT